MAELHLEAGIHEGVEEDGPASASPVSIDLFDQESNGCAELSADSVTLNGERPAAGVIVRDGGQGDCLYGVLPTCDNISMAPSLGDEPRDLELIIEEGGVQVRFTGTGFLGRRQNVPLSVVDQQLRIQHEPRTDVFEDLSVVLIGGVETVATFDVDGVIAVAVPDGASGVQSIELIIDYTVPVTACDFRECAVFGEQRETLSVDLDAL